MEKFFAKEIWNSKMNDFYQREAPDRLVNLFFRMLLQLEKIYQI